MRGKGQWLHKTFRCSRITPAHAGKRLVACGLEGFGRDHPRTRGEKLTRKLLVSPNWGSPPHTRGKEVHLVRHIDCHGITPAHAGKRNGLPAPHLAGWDHPRACGEKPYDVDENALAQGSPPRVRGKGLPNPLVAQVVGITPARAGKSSLKSSSLWCCRDHPRACGEKAMGASPPAGRVGSPPRVRGKDIYCRTSLLGNRITPARAGKS